MSRTFDIRIRDRHGFVVDRVRCFDEIDRFLSLPLGGEIMIGAPSRGTRQKA